MKTTNNFKQNKIIYFRNLLDIVFYKKEKNYDS